MKNLVVALLALFTAVSLFAKEKKVEKTLIVDRLSNEDAEFTMDVTATNFSDSGARFYLRDINGNQVGSLGEGSVSPVNLWILVDTSTLCRKKNIDDRVAKMTKKLRSTLHRDSLVSVVSYTNAALEIHHNHKNIRSIEETNVACNPKMLSTSFERPLSHLLSKKESSGLPTVIWVYSAGNIKMSNNMISKLKARKADLHILVYNPYVVNEIYPLAHQAQLKMGVSRLRFTVLSDKAGLFPEYHRRLTFNPPFAMRGKKARLRLYAMDGEQEIASAPFNLNIPEGGSLLARYFRPLVYSLIAALLVYMIYKVVRFYMPKYCPECKRMIRFADKRCLFCRSAQDAFLIGRFNLKDKTKLAKKDVVCLDRSQTELGTHRKSIVPIVKPSRQRGACYATIVREVGPKGQIAFRLVRTTSDETKVTVNNYPVNVERYLSSGDHVVVDGVEMSFYTGSGGEEPNVA